MDFKGKEIEQDVGCNAMSVWQSYNAATDRIPELSGKATPGHFVTICGQGGTPPLEEFKGNVDINNDRDYSVLLAGPNDDFFADRLLGKKLQIMKGFTFSKYFKMIEIRKINH